MAKTNKFAKYKVVKEMSNITGKVKVGTPIRYNDAEESYMVYSEENMPLKVNRGWLDVSLKEGLIAIDDGTEE